VAMQIMMMFVCKKEKKMKVIETIKEFIAKVKGFFVKHGDINKDGVLSKEDLIALKDKTKDELEEIGRDLGVELDKRLSKSKLITEIKKINKII
tara:strand:+ start:1098 stop:1379 length:282 start_codon:yes stop_codon:yes gene_type:complete